MNHLGCPKAQEYLRSHKTQPGLLKRTIRLGFGSVCHLRNTRYQSLLKMNCMKQNLSPRSKHWNILKWGHSQSTHWLNHHLGSEVLWACASPPHRACWDRTWLNALLKQRSQKSKHHPNDGFPRKNESYSQASVILGEGLPELLMVQPWVHLLASQNNMENDLARCCTS